MGFLGSIGDAISGAVDFVTDGVSSAFDMLTGDSNPLGQVFDVGSQFLLGRSNADHAFGQSEHASAESYARAKDMYQHRYQWTTDDMRKAGLNPIMASSGGFSVGNTPYVASAQAYQAPTPQSVSQSAYNFAAADRERSTVDKLEAETGKVIKEQLYIQQQTLESVERVFKIRADKGLVSAQEQEALQNIRNLRQSYVESVARVSKLYADVRELETRSGLQVAEQSLVKDKAKLLQSEVKQVQVQTEQLRYNAERLSQLSEVYKGKLGPFLTTVEAIFGSIGKLFSGNVSIPVK